MPKQKGFSALDIPDQTGKCFVVTGANTGIGFEISRSLANRGARVLLACREQEKAQLAMDRIRQDHATADLVFVPLDLADLVSIHKAAQLILQQPQIDGLINNAGVMTPPLSRTKQGFELQLGINHLGGFALTSLLLGKLAETPGSRVVVTSSIAHRTAEIDWDDLAAQAGYDRMKRYSASKLANALHFFELDRRLKAAGIPVTAVGCHPGMASTELGRHMGVLQVFNPLVRLVLNSAEKGAWPALQAATGDVKPGGYYGPIGLFGVRGLSGEAKRSQRAQDPGLARRLWETSIALTGVDPGLPACD